MLFRSSFQDTVGGTTGLGALQTGAANFAAIRSNVTATSMNFQNAISLEAATGSVTFTATSGDISVTQHITGANAPVKALEINATGNVSTGGAAGASQDISTFDLTAAGATLNGVNATGDVTITVDSLNLASATLNSTGALTIKPLTAGRTIGLGGGTGDLNLDDAIVSWPDAGGLQVHAHQRSSQDEVGGQFLRQALYSHWFVSVSQDRAGGSLSHSCPQARSEERRCGKECRSRWSTEH